MLECFIKFMDKERFAKQLLLECGALAYCPNDNQIVKTSDPTYVDFTVSLAEKLFIVCSKFEKFEDLEKFIRDVAAKHRDRCDSCSDHPDVITIMNCKKGDNDGAKVKSKQRGVEEGVDINQSKQQS